MVLEIGLNTSDFDKCLTQDGGRDSVLSDIREAQAAGIRVTPSLVLNGKVLAGLNGLDALRKEIDEQPANSKPAGTPELESAIHSQ
ncbi:MAG: DsbA family protein [Blastocatellia bacterium]